jgi:TPR repeat protein
VLFSEQRHSGLPLKGSQVDKLTRAAANGDAEACWALYLYYVEDDEKNAYWLRKAVEYGRLRAFTHLASRLQTQGREGRLKALDLLSKAAEQNFADAQGELGEWYRDGKMVTKDLDTAEYWLRRAATNGALTSMRDIAKLLVNTHQEYRSLVEAYTWTVVLSVRAPQNSGYAKDAGYIRDDITKKAKDLSFNINQIKRDAETQSVKLEKQIPVEIDAAEEQRILMRNVRMKYGD